LTETDRHFRVRTPGRFAVGLVCCALLAMLTARTSAAPVLLIDEQFDADLVTNASSSPHCTAISETATSGNR